MVTCNSPLGFLTFMITLMKPQKNIRINSGRLTSRLAGLANVGSTRLAFTAQDRQGRDFVMAMVSEAGLQAHIDPAANIIVRHDGKTKAPAISCGSHIDTVPDGGSYDGILGCLAGIECLQTIQEAQIETKHPFEVIIFSNEEGQSFSGLTGSRAMVGLLDIDELQEQDKEGRTLADALWSFGGNPEALSQAVRTSQEICAYIELHVEQGGILEKSEKSIGVVEGIVGIQYLEVTFTGIPNHAGTTPMDLRRDALVAASQFVFTVDRTIRTKEFCRVGTVGSMHITPNSRNIIPSEVTMTVDLRDPKMEAIDRTIDYLHQQAKEICLNPLTGLNFKVIEQIQPATADLKLISLIEAVSKDLGLSKQKMPSGAGHDAQMMARIAPMGMIFVPSEGGVSHSNNEFTSQTDCANGANVLLHSMLELDCKE